MVKIKSKDREYIFIFRDTPVKCVVDPEYYNKEDGKKILADLKIICGEIQIDKSYVNSPDNRYKDTFLKEEGWEMLKKLVEKIEFGKSRLTPSQKKILMASYSAMIIEYVRLFFYQLGYDTDGMQFELSNDFPLDVEYRLDTMLEWKNKDR